MLEPLAGTLFWESSQQAFRKIRAVLGERAIEYVEKAAGAFHHTALSGGYESRAEAIDALMIGLEDRKAVFITYQSSRSTEPLSYDVHPYGLIYHRGSLYLVGHSNQHDEIRHWKVDRIEAAEATNFPFRLPENFNLKQHLSKSFGVWHGDGDVRIVIRFTPAVAR